VFVDGEPAAVAFAGEDDRLALGGRLILAERAHRALDGVREHGDVTQT